MSEHGGRGNAEHHDPHGGHPDAPIPATFPSERPAEWGSILSLQPGGATSLLSPGLGNPQRLVNLNGKLRGTRMMTVSAYVNPTIDNASPTNPVPAGPIVGILTFSGGGGGGTIEFDIPCNRAGSPGSGDLAGVSPGGGAMVSVPASTIQLVARNDAALVPNFGAPGAAALGSSAFIPTAQAFVGYGAKTGTLTRTVYAFCFNPAFPAGGGDSAIINVPPFARTFRILRNQSVPADVVVVSLFGPPAPAAGGDLLEAFTLSGVGLSPTFVCGPAARVGLLWPAANAGTLSKMAVVFTIENGSGF